MANFDGITRAFIETGTLNFSFSTGEVTFDQQSDFSHMLDVIEQKITSEKKPAGTLAKALERIAHHRNQLQDALTVLCDTYDRMTNVGSNGRAQRASAVVKARRAMLEAMPDKVLRDVAKLYLPHTIDDFILPDDRAQLIKDTVAAMGGVVGASVG